MKDVMIDLETLGKSAGCVFFSVGAVAYDGETGEIDDGFYSVVSVRSSVCAGLRFDQDTLDFWDKQSEEARAALREAYNPKSPRLFHVLMELNKYLSRFGGKNNVRVWGNAASFDMAILVAAYRAANVEVGWEFWNECCYRQLKRDWPQVELVRSGTHHPALDDAKTQAMHAMQICRFKADVLRRAQGQDLNLNLKANTSTFPANAYCNLIKNQRQLDADGCEVGVSRQALEELLVACLQWNVDGVSDRLVDILTPKVEALVQDDDDLIG
jgi:hypothetical protein